MGREFLTDILGYIQRHWKTLFLFLLFITVLFVVYGLYGLPWGPAFYTALLFTAVLILFSFWDFRHYRQRQQHLYFLRKQAPTHLGALPIAADRQERAYQELLHLLEKRCQDAEERSRQSAETAKEYYTLWSHQIKTPLAAMRLLLREEMPDRSALEQELFKTEQYVEMVLQYQRLGKGPMDLLFQEYSLDFLIRQAIKKTATLFIHKKIALHFATVSCRVITDEKWLVFILEQLLTNAVKYTPKGSVSIYLQPDAPATLVIEDTGIGIRPEDLPRVFEWGYTGYNGRLDKRSTGVGLSLCRQALAMLGHSIQITSEVGKGTRVFLDLSRETLEVE
ncbi:sensor histidine kinase [Clostridium sp. D33t1_170424_F3]|uniref:sensor histidine kinase n=1 Tax=Clostridium sp. D33t1_170424_F3 TaxID=2787099 RepID=UPI0018AC5B0F|nr:sensor histidine kinase [Clostridium sp. D33t1_170424_F3]